MPDIISVPCGLDRADGQGGRPGTPSLDSQIIVSKGGVDVSIDEIGIEELPDSPIIERAEQATITHRFRVSWNNGVTLLAVLPRGLIRIDSYGNYYKLLSSEIKPEKAGYGILTTVEEGASFDSPPDEFECVPVELGLSIIKHPRYFYAFLGDGVGSTTEQQNQMVILLVQNFFENPNYAFRNAIIKLLSASIGSGTGSGSQPPPLSAKSDGTYKYPDGALISGTDLAKRAAMEIIQKYWRGEETPYVVGFQIRWSQYFFYNDFINAGGYIESPITDAVPQLPVDFWSPQWPPDPMGDTIFDDLALFNPQCYSSNGTTSGTVNISWLRQSDSVQYARTWFKITRTWVGSVVGHWDVDLYNQNARPSAPSDYRAINAGS